MSILLFFWIVMLIISRSENISPMDKIIQLDGSTTLPFIVRNGKYGVPAGFPFYINKGQIVIRDKDLLINATGTTLKTKGGPFALGKYGYL